MGNPATGAESSAPTWANRLRQLANGFGASSISHRVEMGIYVFPPRYLKTRPDVDDIYLGRIDHPDLPHGSLVHFGARGGEFGLGDGPCELILRQRGEATALAQFDSLATTCWRELFHHAGSHELDALMLRSALTMSTSTDDSLRWCVLLFLAAWSGKVPTIRADRSTYRGSSTETPPTALWSSWELRHQPFVLVPIDPASVPSTLDQFACRLDTQVFIASQALLNWAAGDSEQDEAIILAANRAAAKPDQPVGGHDDDARRRGADVPHGKAPRTRRGLARLAEVSAKDQPIIAAIHAGDSYRAAAKRCGVSKSTVERVAREYELTGHKPDAVPLDGTLEENLSIRGRPRKRG